jgi:hypothetical protein
MLSFLLIYISTGVYIVKIFLQNNWQLYMLAVFIWYMIVLPSMFLKQAVSDKN